MKRGALEQKIEIPHRSSAEVSHKDTQCGLYLQTVKGGMSKTGFSAEIVWANHDLPWLCFYQSPLWEPIFARVWAVVQSGCHERVGFSTVKCWDFESGIFDTWVPIILICRYWGSYVQRYPADRFWKVECGNLRGKCPNSVSAVQNTWETRMGVTPQIYRMCSLLGCFTALHGVSNHKSPTCASLQGMSCYINIISASHTISLKTAGAKLPLAPNNPFQSGLCGIHVNTAKMRTVARSTEVRT